MNRTDALTDRLIDGTLSVPEALELESLLAADPAARSRHQALLRVELELRDLRHEFHLAEATVAAITTARVERTTSAVMSELAQHSHPAWARRTARRVRITLGLLAAVAALLVVVWFAIPRPEPAPHPQTTAQTTPDLPRITAITGTVEVLAPDGSIAVLNAPVLPSGHVVRTIGDDSTAVLEYADHTRVEVHAETAVRLNTSSANGTPRELFLMHGRVTAAATGRRLVIRTGATHAEASQGEFSLWSSTPGSARIEPTVGDVRVYSGSPTEPVVLGPGRAAYVRDDQSPMAIESALRIDATPLAHLDFHALDVGFGADGEVWAVTAKQWTRWRPGEPDPIRVLFPPKVFNDGITAWFTPDRRHVVYSRIDDREDRTIIRELPSGVERGIIPARASEPRFLCIAPDASWIAMAGDPKPNNRRVYVWDVASGSPRYSRELDDAVTCLATSPDGRWLAVGVTDLGKTADNLIAVFDVATGDLIHDLRTGRKSITTLSFAPDGRTLAAGFNGAIQVWDLSTQSRQQTFEGFERAISRIAWSPDGRKLAAGTHDGEVWIWSVMSGERTQIIQSGTRGVRSLGFSTDGRFLVTATNKAGVAVWAVVPDTASD